MEFSTLKVVFLITLCQFDASETLFCMLGSYKGLYAMLDIRLGVLA